MKKIINSLDLHRTHPKHETASGAALQHTRLVKDQLLAELVELEKQQLLLAQQGAKIDFSMLQTYREMIHSRKVFFNELNR